MKNRFFSLKAAILFVVSFSLFMMAAAAYAVDLPELFDEHEHNPNRVFSMVDEDGNVIMRTARQIVVGDEYINMENNYYRVVSVEGETAVAQLIEKIVLAPLPPESFLERVDRLLRQAIPVQQRERGQARNRRIAIYTTHGAESYIDGDGTETKDPGGGILNVADSLEKALKEKGIEVIRSREPHTPHDAGAYQRSRRTVEEFLKQEPDALIDVHRDAVPEEEYLEVVEGEQRVQVQLVVGRQNQNMATTRQFAEGLKKQSDEQYPGLVKGIFMARGNYNQDMSPRAILIEVGSHTNDKGQAKETVNLFAEVLNDFLYGTEAGNEIAGPGRTTPGGAGGTALRSVIWIVLALIAAVGVFLLISTGGFDQMKSKLKEFRTKEFANLIGAPGEEKDGKRGSFDDKDNDGSPQGR